MRRLIVFTFTFFLIFRFAGAEPPQGRISLEDAMRICMKNLEERYHIAFDAGWAPFVQYEIPKAIPREEALDFEACYYPAEQSFFFHPRYVGISFESGAFLKDTFPAGDTSLLARVASAICHELGHAYADQVSRRMDLGMWPKEEWFPDTLGKEELLVDMLSEGIAEYFGRTFLRDRSEAEIMPEEWEAELSPARYEYLSYEGGYWLMRPLIDAFGDRGIRYAVSHPIALQDGGLKASAFRYWEAAFKDLRSSE